jgi:hypothetical protein
VSDLNNLWNAVDVRSPGDLFATARGGALAAYDHLKTYYVGYGANTNTTTRLRRSVGEVGVRPLLLDYTEPLLVANEPHRVRIVSDGSAMRWWNNGRLVFDYVDPEPYTSGHFGFRTTWSHSGSRTSGCGGCPDLAYARVDRILKRGLSHRPSTPYYGRVGHIRR